MLRTGRCGCCVLRNCPTRLPYLQPAWSVRIMSVLHATGDEACYLSAVYL